MDLGNLELGLCLLERTVRKELKEQLGKGRQCPIFCRCSLSQIGESGGFGVTDKTHVDIPLNTFRVNRGGLARIIRVT